MADNRVIQTANITALTFFPAVETKTGTISTDGTDTRLIVGVGTLFTTELLMTAGTDIPKYYLCDDNGEIRTIDYVIDNTHLVIKSAFTNALAGDACTVLSKLKGGYRSVHITDTTGAIPIGLLDSTVKNLGQFIVDQSQSGVPCFSVQKGTGATTVTAQF